MKRFILAGVLAFSALFGMGLWVFSMLPTSVSNQPNKTTGSTTSQNTNNQEATEGTETATNTSNNGTNENTASGAQIYVSFASHNEDEFHPDYPNYLEDEATFWEHRNNAIAYAEMLTSHGVKYDFQTDWNFLLAVQAFDHGDASTNGKNVIQYLHEDLGVDIDPHSHQNGGYNLVDVAYLISQLGVTPTGVIGGFIAGPVEDSQLEVCWEYGQGEKYPFATWEPKILWGGGTGQHQNESEYWTSGIWRPKSAEEFHVNDDSAPLPIVGHYYSTWEGLDLLLEKLHNGELDENGFYTITIMINQSDMDQANRDTYEAHILEYADEVERGEIAYATISQTYAIWQATQNGVPTILKYDGPETSAALSGSSSRPFPNGPSAECGDGVCTTFERKMNACAADCSL